MRNQSSGGSTFVETVCDDISAKYVGDAVVNETLIGYIEGAPPVPVVNMDMRPNYEKASAIDIANRSTDAKISTFDREIAPGMLCEGKASFPAAGIRWKFETEYGFTTKRKVESATETLDKKTVYFSYNKGEKMTTWGNAFVRGTTAKVYALTRSDNTVISYQLGDIQDDTTIMPITFKISDDYIRQGDLQSYQKLDRPALDSKIQASEANYQFVYDDMNPYNLAVGSDDFKETAKIKNRQFRQSYCWAYDGDNQLIKNYSFSDENSYGGSFSLKTAFGLYIAWDVSAGFIIQTKIASGELSVLGTFRLNVARSKGEKKSEAINYNLDASGERQGIKQGGKWTNPNKIYAYHFYTYCLAQDANNFEAFFNDVVDKDWLTNDKNPYAHHQEAKRLRELSGRHSDPWRITYRVTEIHKCGDSTLEAANLGVPDSINDEEAGRIIIEDMTNYYQQTE